MKKITFTLVLACLAGSMMGAKDVTRQSLAWYTGWLSVRFHPRWSWQSDFGNRIFMQPWAQHQMFFRTHFRYHTTRYNTDFAVGFSVFGSSPNNPRAAHKLIVPELRPHLEAILRNEFSSFSLEHRFRAEARFFHNTDTLRTTLTGGFTFSNFRFRYRLMANIPIWKISEHRSLNGKIGNEIFINAGRDIVINIFDHNRIMASLAFQVNKWMIWEAGYIYWYQLNENGTYFSRNIVSVTTHFIFNVRRCKSASSP
ncbi:MAG: DUF2490 domain-containing protein [Chitinophagales bacterium]|nr:DUF2490 domain-containing protein [Chitinophagales bacterium]